jgi:hypothetical protein
MRSSVATAGELLISYPSTQQATTPTHLLRPAMLWPRSVVLGYAGGFARSRPITQQPAPSVTREETAAEAARPPQAFMSHSLGWCAGGSCMSPPVRLLVC